MAKSKIVVSWWVLGFLAMPPAEAGDTNDAMFEKASAAALSGDLVAMQLTYEQILNGSPDNVRALHGKATAMAWQGDYEDAQATFRRALAIDKYNIDALVGLGYAYAWDGQFVAAHTQFQHALRIEPTHIGARKGIAFSFHWQGENDLALGAFETAGSLAPDDAEIEEAMGRVTRDLGRTRDSIPHFDRALMLDPNRRSALLAKRAAYTSAPTLELSSRFGTTSNAGSGLRQLELVHWPDESTRFAVRYDNSLGLDNPSIADRGADAPGYFGSIQKTFRERFTLGAEIGSRDLVENRQTLVALQGTYFAPFGAVRLGMQQGRTNDGSIDNLVFAGISVPLARQWRVEPMLYLSETGAAGDNEWRAIVGIDYVSDSSWQAGAFFGGGDIDSADSRFSGETKSAGLRASYLLADKYSINVSLRRDEAPTSSFTVAEIGFTYRLISN